MIPHGGDEMHALALRCPAAGHSKVNGWWIDAWGLTTTDVDLVASLYRATLVPDIDDEIENEILENGVTVGELLIDADNSRDSITRSDATELAAAASFLAADQWPAQNLVMPNVPKLSRRRSDSGFDAMTVTLGGDPRERELSTQDLLYIGSVKHTITLDASGVRYELVKSVSNEMAATYVARQLVVLHGNLVQQGTSKSEAQRLFRFLRHLNDSTRVKIHGAMVIDPRASISLQKDLRNLPVLTTIERWIRIIEIPDLPNLHDRCA